MGLRINLNIASLIAQRNLQNNTIRLNKAYEQLTSGERINRAGDDASGLAVSQLMRSQIASLNQAVKNAGDGQSVLDTAETALGNAQDMVQRIRELSVQAANDTNSSENRGLIQEEINALLEEISRISETVQFNGRMLLDGTFNNQRIQIGLTANDYLPVTIPDMRATVLGQQAIVTSNSAVTTTPIIGGGDLIINGIAIGATEPDSVSFSNKNSSAVAKANAINRLSSQTGVTATATASVYQAAGASIGAVSLDGLGSSLYINGVNIGEVDATANDETGTLRDAINAVTIQTGVKASLGAGGELVLTAEDGRNFEITTTGSVADELGLQVGDGDLTAQVVTGGIRLNSSENITVAGSNIGVIGFDAGQASTLVDPASAIANLSVQTQEDAETAIVTADAALSQLNRVRAALGSVANRVSATIDSLELTSQNLLASDSRIRSTDYAKATAEATQQQILQEAAVAILAQANTLPSMALQLLQR